MLPAVAAPSPGRRLPLAAFGKTVDRQIGCLIEWEAIKLLVKFQFLEENMHIDFNEIASMTFPGMDNGTGMMSARMYNDDSYRIIPTAIHPGGSIGNHKQNSGDDMNYIISGTGKAFCDGVEEDLKPGVMHICPQGSEHSIVNTGEEDLVMLTIVVKK